jgi:purine-nucleoside phosphorylase
MAGRRHIYEGLSPADAVLLPQLILQGFPNVSSILISNAAGGLNPTFSVGDLMLLSDHINWMFRNPLRGADYAHTLAREKTNHPVYDARLRNLAHAVATDLGIGLRDGTYIAMTGPSYETRSEITMARHLFGADAVGMSTVPEATMAAAAGCRVLGISFISNLLVQPAPLTHEEVVANSALVEEKFSRFVIALIEKLHTH